MSDIEISFIMTVYNKAKYLPAVMKALLKQTGLKKIEYIFCDDFSKDDSMKIIEEATKNIPNVKIVKNKANEGISAKTNQGISLATGKWVRILDADDVLPLNSTEKMISLAEKLNADIVYGTFKKTGLPADLLVNDKLPNDFSYKYSKNALNAILSGRFTRMSQLFKNEILQKCQGADPRIFIQDESIPLRAGKFANGVIKMNTDVILVPKVTGNFSENKIQMDHDRFLAYYYFFVENKDFPLYIRKKIYKRAISAFYKYQKKIKKLPLFNKYFYKYILAKIGFIDLKYLDFAKTEFAKQKDMRVPPEGLPKYL